MSSYDDAVSVSHLTKDYGVFRLEDVSMTVPKGTVMGLIGENGAGKSTFLRCLLGLAHPDAGEIRILGMDAAGQRREVLARTAVVLDECPFHERMTPRMVGVVLGGACPGWDETEFRTLLEELELPADKTVKEFSRGMKMKLSMAAALARHPKVLLLDEATSGLDPVVRDHLLDKLRDFVSDGERAVILSSHITSDLEKLADYVTYLHRGRVTAQGVKDELLESYGRLACTRAELAEVDPALLAGTRIGQFQCEALVRDKAAFRRRYPGLPVDPASLEDIMVFTAGRDER